MKGITNYVEVERARFPCSRQACLCDQELLLWAVKRGLHVLSDEIYANSKFGLVVSLQTVLVVNVRNDELIFCTWQRKKLTFSFED